MIVIYKRGVIMKEFWKNEWNLFLNDMKELGEFFLQPVEITGIPGRSNVMLKPTVEETRAKASEGGFWAREWNQFLNDMEKIGDFCMQPVEITMPGQGKNNPSANGFWANEWELFNLGAQFSLEVEDLLEQEGRNSPYTSSLDMAGT